MNKQTEVLTKEECEKIESDFQRTIGGCKKKTGYFESSPYYCGSLVQTTPKDGFTSYCRKCLPKVKEAFSRWDTMIIPARERLRELNKKEVPNSSQD